MTSSRLPSRPNLLSSPTKGGPLRGAVPFFACEEHMQTLAALEAASPQVGSLENEPASRRRTHASAFGGGALASLAPVAQPRPHHTKKIPLKKIQTKKQKQKSIQKQNPESRQTKQTKQTKRKKGKSNGNHDHHPNSFHSLAENFSREFSIHTENPVQTASQGRE